jgi:hypothetical protein
VDGPSWTDAVIVSLEAANDVTGAVLLVSCVNSCSTFVIQSYSLQSGEVYNHFPLLRLHTATMTEAWKERQLKWLAIGHEVRRRELDSSVEFEEFPEPGSSQVALLQIFTDTLDENVTPATAAKQISGWVLSVPDSDICYDISNAYANMMGVLFSATSQLPSRKHLQILADLTVELVNQPDAYNKKDKPLKFESGSVVVPPGERIVVPCISGGELWSGLPDFAFRMGDDLNRGPPNFLPLSVSGRRDQHQIDRNAEEKYTNINTFAALIAKQHPPEESPLRSCLHCAFIVFAFLEHGLGTERGKWSHLAVRAAATWLIIAGEELVNPGPPSTVAGYISGSLWEAEGGTNTVDIKRLRFWKERFQHFRESGRLVSQEAMNATHHATAVLDRLIDAQG